MVSVGERQKTSLKNYLEYPVLGKVSMKFRADWGDEWSRPGFKGDYSKLIIIYLVFSIINHSSVFGCEGTFGFLFHHNVGRLYLWSYSGTSL